MSDTINYLPRFKPAVGVPTASLRLTHGPRSVIILRGKTIHNYFVLWKTENT